MNKRDRFLAELAKAAKARGLSFRVQFWRGKGGHAMVWVGEGDDRAVEGDRPQDGTARSGRPSASIEETAR